MTYNEARIRSQFPPEKFQEMKDKLPAQVSSYVEWLAVIKRRFETMRQKRPQIEAEARRACPPELFREFKEKVDCRKILYASDGLSIEGFILKPQSPPTERLPVILYNHGGNPRVGILDDTRLLHLTWLVRAGYVVVASQYRGCGGSDDQNCVPRCALEMGLQLEQFGQPFRLIFFESGSHGLQEHADEVHQQTLLWFEKYLSRPAE